jgi:hypothetical protein
LRGRRGESTPPLLFMLAGGDGVVESGWANIMPAGSAIGCGATVDGYRQYKGGYHRCPRTHYVMLAVRVEPYPLGYFVNLFHWEFIILEKNQARLSLSFFKLGSRS